MTRVKRWATRSKARKELHKATKWYRMLNSRGISTAKNAWMKAWLHAYVGRKNKKRDFRRLWNVRINNAARENDTTYSKFINDLYKANVKLNRKVLSNLAITNPNTFTKVVEFVK